MPKVSVILPVYNVEKYIAKSIESVLNQTFSDFELLVIIDGSPDNSKLVAESFQDERIRIFEKENGGLSDARNYGLERANGKFIYFMDSDDWIESNLLEDNLKIVEEEKLNFIVFGYILDSVDINNKVVQTLGVNCKDNTFSKVDKNLEIDENLLGLLGYAWNKIYRKSFLDYHKLQFEKGTSLIEDILFNAQVYIKTDKIRLNSGVYYHYMNRPVQTLIKQFHFNSFDLNLRKTKKIESFFEDWNLDESKSKKILSFSSVQGLRYCVHNLFTFKNNLSFAKKTGYLKKMVNHDDIKKRIKYYCPVSISDKIYKLLIQSQSYRTIALLAYLKK